MLLGGTSAAYAWSQQQYYVAADGPQVAIYKGVQVDLPGVELSRPYEVDDLRVEELPAFRQAEIEDGKVADDLEDARRIVTELEAEAEAGGGRDAVADPPVATRSASRSAERRGGRRRTAPPTRSPRPTSGPAPGRDQRREAPPPPTPPPNPRPTHRPPRLGDPDRHRHDGPTDAPTDAPTDGATDAPPMPCATGTP